MFGHGIFRDDERDSREPADARATDASLFGDANQIRQRSGQAEPQKSALRFSPRKLDAFDTRQSEPGYYGLKKSKLLPLEEIQILLKYLMKH